MTTNHKYNSVNCETELATGTLPANSNLLQLPHTKQNLMHVCVNTQKSNIPCQKARHRFPIFCQGDRNKQTKKGKTVQDYNYIFFKWQNHTVIIQKHVSFQIILHWLLNKNYNTTLIQKVEGTRVVLILSADNYLYIITAQVFEQAWQKVISWQIYYAETKSQLSPHLTPALNLQRPRKERGKKTYLPV